MLSPHCLFGLAGNSETIYIVGGKNNKETFEIFDINKDDWKCFNNL